MRKLQRDGNPRSPTLPTLAASPGDPLRWNGWLSGKLEPMGSFVHARHGGFGGGNASFGSREHLPASRDSLKILLLAGALWCVGSLVTCHHPPARTQTQQKTDG